MKLFGVRTKVEANSSKPVLDIKNYYFGNYRPLLFIGKYPYFSLGPDCKTCFTASVQPAAAEQKRGGVFVSDSFSSPPNEWNSYFTYCFFKTIQLSQLLYDFSICFIHPMQFTCPIPLDKFFYSMFSCLAAVSIICCYLVLSVDLGGIKVITYALNISMLLVYAWTALRDPGICCVPQID